MLQLDDNDFDTTVVVVTFFPDEPMLKMDTPVQQIPAPVDIFNDDINEATEQLFVVTLTIVESVNVSLVNNSVRNFSLCRIRDDDRMFELKYARGIN